MEFKVGDDVVCIISPNAEDLEFAKTHGLVMIYKDEHYIIRDIRDGNRIYLEGITNPIIYVDEVGYHPRAFRKLDKVKRTNKITAKLAKEAMEEMTEYNPLEIEAPRELEELNN